MCTPAVCYKVMTTHAQRQPASLKVNVSVSQALCERNNYMKLFRCSNENKYSYNISESEHCHECIGECH